MKFADGDADVVRDVEERELDEVGGVEPLAIEHIGEEHLEEDVVRNDGGLARALEREEAQALARASSGR